MRDAGDRVQRVGQQVDQDLLERVRRDHQRRQVGRDLRAQGRAALAQAEVQQRRDAHQHGADLGAPGGVLGRGHGQQPQARHQRRQPLRLLDDVAREIQHLVQLDAILLQQQLREALDGEQRLAQLVNLLRGEAAELGQPSRGGDSRAATIAAALQRRAPVGACSAWSFFGLLLPQVGRLGCQRGRRGRPRGQRRRRPAACGRRGPRPRPRSASCRCRPGR